MTESSPGKNRTPATGPSRPRLDFVPALNGLRGIAILLVLGNHIPLCKYFCHWSGWRVIAIGMPLALAATVLSYYGLEKPILKFKTRFAAKN